MIFTTNAAGIMNEDNDTLGPTANNFCRDYIRGCCTRENCRYMHEIPPKPFLKELFRFCHDFQNKGCYRMNCKFIHSTVEDEEHFYTSGVFPRDPRTIPVCQAYIHGSCANKECKYVHPPEVGTEAVSVHTVPPPQFNRPPPPIRDDDSPPEAKFRRFAFEENGLENQVLTTSNMCLNCETLDHKVKLLHDNISVLLKKVADLTEKNLQLTSMNEFLLEQTASIRTDQSCVITSRHGTSAPVSLATVSVTPVVSLAGALPALVPAAATSNLALAPAASRAQLLTPAPQILTVSTTQQLVGNSGALIVTSAGAQQLMQVSDSGTLMGGGQTVVAVPAQLTLAPPAQQLMGNASQTAVQQLVQQSALQPQLAPQHQASQYATQQSVQHLAAAQQSAQHLAQQSAQHLAAQQSAQHLAAQQSAQHLAAQQSAQHLAAQQNAQHLAAQQNAQHLAAQQSAQHLAAAAQQSAQQLAAAAQQSAQQIVAQQSAQQLAAQQSQQQLVPSAPQLMHQTSTQQITISSTSQPMALPNSQAQPITFPIISQSILPH
ncbi:probable basic-leucine zipper transcription factor P [Manduca sexta]|uniref:probable basic-leucine zipper transcription factor P n=1 Tax=Manduca sexta TaxID=7130 RepID=UPI00118366A2|nr:probable basic-leucine zipper transcription factor P [Manduca sexta]